MSWWCIRQWVKKNWIISLFLLHCFEYPHQVMNLQTVVIKLCAWQVAKISIEVLWFQTYSLLFFGEIGCKYFYGYNQLILIRKVLWSYGDLHLALKHIQDRTWYIRQQTTYFSMWLQRQWWTSVICHCPMQKDLVVDFSCMPDVGQGKEVHRWIRTPLNDGDLTWCPSFR